MKFFAKILRHWKDFIFIIGNPCKCRFKYFSDSNKNVNLNFHFNAVNVARKGEEAYVCGNRSAVARFSSRSARTLLITTNPCNKP